ncbi:MAG: isopentenyl phosphate kinase family protein [Anaerolineales bacterium]|nr:isopentenyl phosphate kinase family protein [Anaerolineales bacterium]
MPTLLFLKLGGSLITDKATPRTLRGDVLTRLMGEITAAQADGAFQLVLGHGSGSFGHIEGKRYGTRDGVHSREDWRGFAEVQAAAALLNRHVIDAARAAGLPVFNCPPSASAVCRDGRIESLALEPITHALAHGLVPVVQGDVAVDRVRGGTIVSTEDVFGYLAPRLKPARLLLAGRDPGVLTRWPDGDLVPEIVDGTAVNAGAAQATDVTGGMVAKIFETLNMVRAVPGLTALIFSGDVPGQVAAALRGEPVPGTRLRQANQLLG